MEPSTRITSEICTAFEHREYCTAIFLDVAQAFDREWLLPQNTHSLLKTYLYNRVFAIRCNTSTSRDCAIEAGGNVLGTLLYTGFPHRLQYNNLYVRYIYRATQSLQMPNKSHGTPISRLKICKTMAFQLENLN